MKIPYLEIIGRTLFGLIITMCSYNAGRQDAQESVASLEESLITQRIENVEQGTRHKLAIDIWKQALEDESQECADVLNAVLSPEEIESYYKGM